MNPFYSVSAHKYSEKNIMESVRDMISDCLPTTSHSLDPQQEFVVWATFETVPPSVVLEEKAKFILLLSTNRSFSIWSIMENGKASLVLSLVNANVPAAKLLPYPHEAYSDYFTEHRPLIAICGEERASWNIFFTSLLTGNAVRTYKSHSAVSSIEANRRFVLIVRVDCISVLSAHTLVELFAIGNLRTPARSLLAKCLPVALGSRWLAFPDSQPIYHHMSLCGDASCDSWKPVATTVLNVKERIMDGLSALTSSVSIGGGVAMATERQLADVGVGGGGGGGGSAGGDASSEGSFVSVVDLVGLSANYASLEARGHLESPVSEAESLRQAQEREQFGLLQHRQQQGLLGTGGGYSGAPVLPQQPISACVHCHLPVQSPGQQQAASAADTTVFLAPRQTAISVHDYADNGALLAHFMAHRWANVGYLAFDDQGTLLGTACTQGHSFNVFSISPHPRDPRETAVHHLYVLNRGSTSCEVVDMSFSPDSRWLAVTSNHGTTHVFAITPYGGPITVRTHTRPRLVNRTSRYHRSAGLEEYHLTRPQPSRSLEAPLSTPSAAVVGGTTALSSSTAAVAAPASVEEPGRSPACRVADVGGDSGASSPVGCGSHLEASTEEGCRTSPNVAYNTTNARLPPYPEPCCLQPEARLRPRAPPSASYSAATSAAAASVVNNAVAGAFSSQTRSSQQVGLSAGALRMAASFQSPICAAATAAQFAWPHGGRAKSFKSTSSAAANPAGTSSAAGSGVPGQDSSIECRYASSLMTLTYDAHLIEYELVITPDESDAKVSQEGPIKLRCTPLGQWHLHADATPRVPPFPPTHPLVSILVPPSPSQTDATFTEPPTDTVFEPASENSSTKAREVPQSGRRRRRQHLASDTTLSRLGDSSTAAADAMSAASSLPVGSTTTTEGVRRASTLAPAGWAPHDASSYWFSQVEVCTHQQPSRHLWMGPQFSFHTYPTSREGLMPKTDTYLYLEDQESSAPMASALPGGCSTEGLCCSCGGGGGGGVTTSASSLNEPPVPSSSSCSYTFRGGSGGFSGPLHQVSYGSFHDSSLGGSMCSLSSRGGHDVVGHALIDAMQDEAPPRTARLSGSQSCPFHGQQQPQPPQQPFQLQQQPQRCRQAATPVPSKLLIGGNRDSLFCENDFPQQQPQVESSRAPPPSPPIMLQFEEEEEEKERKAKESSTQPPPPPLTLTFDMDDEEAVKPPVGEVEGRVDLITATTAADDPPPAPSASMVSIESLNEGGEETSLSSSPAIKTTTSSSGGGGGGGTQQSSFSYSASLRKVKKAKKHARKKKTTSTMHQESKNSSSSPLSTSPLKEAGGGRRRRRRVSKAAAEAVKKEEKKQEEDEEKEEETRLLIDLTTELVAAAADEDNGDGGGGGGGDDDDEDEGGGWAAQIPDLMDW